jgi:hypothetical protein
LDGRFEPISSRSYEHFSEGLLVFTRNIEILTPTLAVRCTINLLPMGRGVGEAGLPEGTAFISDWKQSGHAHETGGRHSDHVFGEAIAPGSPEQ